MQLELTIDMAKRPFAIYEQLLDGATREAMVGAAGARAAEVTVAGGEMTVRREVETAVPPQLRNFLKQWNRVIQTERWEWDGEKEMGNGRVSIKIQGVPLSIDGTGQITAVDAHCQLAFELLAYCGVPFVGPTLARSAAQMVRQNLELELAYLANLS